MNIQEATKLAIEKDAFISREGSPFDRYLRIKPTNADGGCLLVPTEQYKQDLLLEGTNKTHSKWWQPYAEDLMADDWYVSGLD